MIRNDDSPSLVGQHTIRNREDKKIERWDIEVKAVNKWTAKQKAKLYARRLDSSVSKVLNPQVEDIEDTEQATFDQLFPDRWGRENYTVSLIVFR